MKIVVLDGFITNPGDLSWEGFSRLGEFVCHDRTPRDQIAASIGADTDAVLSNGTHIDEAIMRACPKLKYIGLLSTGYNYVDLRTAAELGITVTNIPAYSSMAVAQHALALLLEITNQIGYYDRTVKEGRWSRSPDACYYDMDRPLIELDGLTMGVVGYGGIGQSMARMALGLGMKVLVNRKRRDRPPQDAGVAYADLDELYQRSDVISLHVPLFDATRGMINASSLATMRDGVIIINASRGQLVAEDALAAALASGKVRAYGADVASVEPINKDNPLLTARNCFLTPHLAWAPLATRKRLLGIALDNLTAFIEGKAINVVAH